MPNPVNETLTPGSDNEKRKPRKSLSFGSFFFLALLVYGFWQISNHYLDEWFRNSELTASGYAVIAKDYESLSEKTKSFIDSRMAKGYLTVGDTTPIYDAMLDDLDSIQLGPSSGDPEVSTTQTIYRRVMGIPTESKAKDLLLQHRQQ